MKVANSATVRLAAGTDLPAIRRIFNEGIVDRVATLDEDEKSEAEMRAWWEAHDEPHAVFVADRGGAVVGWAAINRYNNRCAYRGVGDLSVYVAREARGTGVGAALLAALERGAAERGFHKLVLFTFGFNEAGQRLYRARGFREVGVFRNQGKLDGAYVDVMAMEKMLD
jgi:phosphinothricin acetyltransferase